MKELDTSISNSERALLGMPLLVRVILCCEPGSRSAATHDCTKYNNYVFELPEKRTSLYDSDLLPGSGDIYIRTSVRDTVPVFKVEALP